MGLYRLISAVPVDLNGQGSASELLPTVGPPTSSSHSGGRVERRRIRIPFRYLFITSLLPLVALFTCVFISAVFHREHTVNTTCGVRFLFCSAPHLSVYYCVIKTDVSKIIFQKEVLVSGVGDSSVNISCHRSDVPAERNLEIL